MGVRSCRDVVHLYRLLWASTVLNVLGLCLGIVTAAVLGAFKDMVSGVLLCASIWSVIAPSARPSPSRELSGSFNRGGPKLSLKWFACQVATRTTNHWCSKHLTTHWVTLPSPTLLGGKSLLPSKNKTSLCHCGIHGCLGMVVLGRAWTPF